MAAKHYFTMLLLVSLMALIASNSSFEKDCPENSHLTMDPCAPTCEDPDLTHTSCVAALLPTCHCDDGFLFDKSGKCVPVDECPDQKNCPENSHLTMDPCAPTCEDPELKNTSCVAALLPTCHCDDGFLFDKSGKCVPVDECPDHKNCPENSHLTMDPCAPTCEDPELKNTSCAAALLPTCHCDDGFLFDKSGKCVPVEECPDQKNECVN
ncbi:serine protease inhibitor swm-1 [Bombyx mori]|uniref:EGF-like domain-containing protein n=1 Tax=Bombyx mori TaxID=7091 RepID=A0A8R1WLE6_BOMMO|nr:serine protease inhibitor swm-1 [Bombyx mori]